MNDQLFNELYQYSTETILDERAASDLNAIKTHRIATKDIEWHEVHTVAIAGGIHNRSRMGFDGSNGDINYEVKTSSKAAGTSPKKFNGAGYFSCFSKSILERYDNGQVWMLVSGYIDGVLMFIVKFPFRHDTFRNHLVNTLGTAKSKTITFTYRQYLDCKDVKTIFLTKKENLHHLEKNSTKPFFEFLLKNS